MSDNDRPLPASGGTRRAADAPTVKLPAAGAGTDPRAEASLRSLVGVAGGAFSQPPPASSSGAAPPRPGRAAAGTPFPAPFALAPAVAGMPPPAPFSLTPAASTPAASTPAASTPAAPELPLGTGRSAWDSPSAAAPASEAIGPALQPGTRINQYEIIKLLGEGGMGSVFLARDLRLGRRVAIKFLRSNEPEQSQRFQIEARATARCQHENIIVIYEVGEYAGAPYIVLEYLSGKPLTHLTENGQKLPYTRAVELMIPILRALGCAHAHGIVHRDLKPDNVFVTESGTIKVLDFGIAKVVQHAGGDGETAGPTRMPSPLELATGSDAGLTRVGSIMGTLQYMSPEQWGIGVEIDHLSDVWACGILLHRLICGQHPLYPLDGSQLVVTAMLDIAMPSMAQIAPPDVPRELIQIVDRCLRKAKAERWQSVAELMTALEPFLPGRHTQALLVDESPYAGLSPFQENDAGKFFGRSREIAAMVTRIRDRPLVAVVGSSGVGKSSLVRAGLVPALKHSGEVWEVLVARPGRTPLDALAGVLAPMITTAANLADEVGEHKKLVDTLRSEPGHLGHVLRLRARRDHRRIMLFVDQFEELYTQTGDPAERAAFTACLAAVADDATSPLRVVLSFRSDFLDRVAEDPAFAGELTQGLFFLGPPGRDGLRDAITQPAELAGFQFELPATVEDMLDHLETTPDALPLLQFTAAKLWELRDTARRLLTHQAYAAMGGVAGALASHADRFVAELGAHKTPLVRALLLRLVTAERTRAIVPVAELLELSHEPDEVRRLIDQLVDARLLVVQTLEGGKGSTAEIIHESLIQGWPTLRRWLDENQDDAELVDQLRVAAQQWHHKGYDAGLLWRGDAAAEAGKLRARYKGPLSDVERAFLDAVVAHETARVRRRRRAIVGGFAALSLVVVATMVLLVVIQRARELAQDSAYQAQLAQRTAEAAEHEARRQRDQAERNLQERIAAEQRSTALASAKRVVDAELMKSKEELIRERDHATQSAEQAVQARHRAEASARLAAAARREAQAAQSDTARANRELAAALEKEHARVQQLTDKLGSRPITELRRFDRTRRERP